MRRKARRVDIIIIIVLVAAIITGVLFAVLGGGESGKSALFADRDGSGAITYKDYIGTRVGIETGSSFEKPTFEYLPDSPYFYFDTVSDLLMALEQDKIDCFICDEPVLRMARVERPQVDLLPDVLREDEYSFCFQKTGEKGEKLRKQFNEMLAELTADGSLEKMKDKWFSGDPAKVEIDRSGITGENGTLNVFVNPANIPFAMIADGELKGYAVELTIEFCRRYGYDCKFDQATVSSGLAGITSGIYDIGANSTTVTPEREESVRFSDPIYIGGISLAVRTADINSTVADAKSKLVPAVTLGELNDPGRSVAVWTGAAGMIAVETYLPDAKELMFDSTATACEAVRAGHADAFVFERRQLQTALDNGMQGLMLLDENLGGPIDVAVGLSRATKIKGLENSINRFIAEKKADGTLDDMYKRWIVDKNYTMPEIAPAASPSFTLVVGTTGTVEPYSFYSDNGITGYDVEMARLFAAWLGADIEFKVIDYSGIIAAAQSGSIDCIFANLNVTDERKEAIDFSDTIYSIENGILVRAVSDQKSDAEPSWFDSIAESFEKNFVREDRWKMILEGIGTTCLITAMSALIGSVIGFLVCLFRRTGSRLANIISDIYVKLLQGTPIVVLLMILYYVVLGKSGFAPVWVAIIGFSLNFGAYASEIMCSGIDSIDGGQREAALALGYSENQAFFRFIFPQAAVRFLPVYRGEIVSLLKSTSIVGYIAIQDLTKMSDIIRSRTYEAFFPLIATAVIYFILAWIISLIVKFLFMRIDPKHRKRGAAK